MMSVFQLSVSRSAGVPLHRQIYEEIRRAVLTGQLAPGARVPSTRALATDLGVSRNTASGAYDQLLAEGYLVGHTGSGTYVGRAIPEELLRVPEKSAATQRVAGTMPVLSRRGRVLASTKVSPVRDRRAPLAFQAGLPALDAFPRALWARIGARIVRHAPAGLFGYGDAAGYAPLRRAIADYLKAARGVRCDAEQVVVTAGSQQALDLAARVLLDRGMRHGSRIRDTWVRAEHSRPRASGACRCGWTPKGFACGKAKRGRRVPAWRM